MLFVTKVQKAGRECVKCYHQPLQSWAEAPIATLYLLLFIDAIAGTMGRPARTAILPRIVPRRLFPRAVTWNFTLFQLAAVIGPGVGGFVVAWSIPAASSITGTQQVVSTGEHPVPNGGRASRRR